MVFLSFQILCLFSSAQLPSHNYVRTSQSNKYSFFNFIDGANEHVEYEYNGVEALVKDLNRGMTVSYDNQNNPRRIDFTDGNSITYNYLPDGTLLS